MVDQIAEAAGRPRRAAAGAADHRPQGRTRGSLRAAARPGFRARAHRRPRARARRAAEDRRRRRSTPSRSWWIDCASVRMRRNAAGRIAGDGTQAIRRHGATGAIRCGEAVKAADETLFSSRQACPECGYSVPALEPKMFSFNSPAGACPTCDGHRAQGLLRSCARRRLSTSLARGRRHQELGSQECLLLRADHRDGKALQVRSRDAVG